MTFLVSCVFAAFCPALAGCAEGQDRSIALKARLDEATLIAEFWTPAAPPSLPWPAVLSVVEGFGPKSWHLFSSGDLHGTWVLSVVLSDARHGETFDATGAVSAHFLAFGDLRQLTGMGDCTVTREVA